MKKSYLFTMFLFIFTINSIFSQMRHDSDSYFNDHHPIEFRDVANYSASTNFDSSTYEPIVFNVHFYGLEKTTEPYTGDNALSEEFVLENIAKLNILYNPYNIFFKYRGYTLHSEIYDGGELMNATQNKVLIRMPEVIGEDGYENSINIILYKENCSQAMGVANIEEKILLFRYCVYGFNDYLLAYQMGHLLGLFKVQHGTVDSGYINDPFFETIPQDPICDNPDFIYPYPYEGGGYLFVPDFNVVDDGQGTPENITRDTGNPYFNANVAGDMVVDTPASFLGAGDNYCHDYDDPIHEYISHPDIVDNSPEHLMYEDLDLHNLMYKRWDGMNMNYAHFTDGQGIRMHETIAIPSLYYDEVETTLASLYEPYMGEYRRIGPEQGADESPHFQWGFDYEFIDCSGDYELPSNYEDISFDYTEEKLNEVSKYDWYLHVSHPNHSAIRIIQIDKNQPRKCYDNWNRRPSSGSITKFHDGIINNNYTIYSKDSLQINNSSLIQDLQNGLYKINKQYNDGSQEQNVIIKNNE